jgi:uncharacterized RDD family membrane protein YckC
MMPMSSRVAPAGTVPPPGVAAGVASVPVGTAWAPGYPQGSGGERHWPSGRRIGAWFIDLAAYLVFAIIVGLIFRNQIADQAPGYCQGRGFGNGFCFQVDGDVTTTSPMANFLGLLWFVLVHCVLQGMTGASIGKHAVGLRVVKEDGALCGFGRATARSVLWIVDGIPFCVPLVGLVTWLATGEKRRVGDLVAGTWVVPAGEVGTPIHGGAPMYGGATYPPAPDAGGYPPPPPPASPTWDPPTS